MKRTMFALIIAGLLVFGLVSVSFAQKTITVSATLPTITSSMTTDVAKVNATSGVWDPVHGDIPIAFGTLTQDTLWKVFRAPYYFVCDVGVTGNDGANWTITHTRSDILRPAGGNLNANVNVTVVKQTSSAVGTELAYLAYADSQNKPYTKAQLAGGWLRIYYGIATGLTVDSAPFRKDALNVLPIGLDTPAGTYTGSVTLTLS